MQIANSLVNYEINWNCFVSKLFNGCNDYLQSRMERLVEIFAGGRAKAIEDADLFPAVNCQISSKKIIELLKDRQICAADIQCLDKDSKLLLKELCLQTCLIAKNKSGIRN